MYPQSDFCGAMMKAETTWRWRPMLAQQGDRVVEQTGERVEDSNGGNVGDNDMG